MPFPALIECPSREWQTQNRLSGISSNRFIVQHPRPSHPIRKTNFQDIVTFWTPPLRTDLSFSFRFQFRKKI